jgi:anti-sigma regulatory factor (Ser/Thr protein kinase)
MPLEDPAEPASDSAQAALLDHEITPHALHLLREAVLAHAAAAGMSESRATVVMLAVHELAANVITHGAGTGQLRIRVAEGALHCEVSDPGPARFDGGSPAAATQAAASDRSPAFAVDQPAPWPQVPGHGLWLVQQSADKLTTSTGPHGSRVTVSFALPWRGTPPNGELGR